MLLEHLPLFLLSQALVRRGEATGGRNSKGRSTKRRRKSQCRRRRKLKRSNMNGQQTKTLTAENSMQDYMNHFSPMILKHISLDNKDDL